MSTDMVRRLHAARWQLRLDFALQQEGKTPPTKHRTFMRNSRKLS